MDSPERLWSWMIFLPRHFLAQKISKKFMKILKFQFPHQLFPISNCYLLTFISWKSHNFFFHFSHDSCETETKKRKLDEVTSGTPVLVLPTGIVPCNSHIRQMIKIVKPYIWHLVEDANLVKINYFLLFLSSLESWYLISCYCF